MRYTTSGIGVRAVVATLEASRSRALVVVAALLLTPLTASAGQLTLAWDPSPAANVRYTVYYGTSSGHYTQSVETMATTQTVVGLSNGVRYYFVVRASAGGVQSAPTNEISGLPISQPPVLLNPGSVTVKAGAFAVALAASDPEGDPITFSASGFPAGVAIESTSGTIVGVLAAGSYNVTVTVTDGAMQTTAAFTLRVTANAMAPFTDDPLVPRVHAMRALHIDELRARINALRTNLRLSTIPWSEATTASVAVIKATHIAEMRAALDDVYGRVKQPPPQYAEGTLAAGTPIKAVHIMQLRAAVRALE